MHSLLTFDRLNLPDSILQEFAQLTPNNTVYKLIGPVLVQQDQADAKTNVDTRLDFIRGEMCAPIVL
jgi:prefoldin beta subunit